VAWLGEGRGRWALAGVLVVAVAAAVIVAWPLVQRCTGAAPPAQFYGKAGLGPALAHRYARVLGVAHNAGSNAGTLATALRSGAGVVGIDVISARGQLVAGRDQPWPWLARLLFGGPALIWAWDHAAAARIVRLDLKQTDRGFLDDLVAFLAPRAASRRVMISSPGPGALLYLHPRLPDVTLLFSAAWPDAARQPKAGRALQKAIGGVPVFQGLVDANLVAWAHQHTLLILAWTVNDGQRASQLVRLGADAITTANLAILRALG
jgi:hypothetical protein